MIIHFVHILLIRLKRLLKQTQDLQAFCFSSPISSDLTSRFPRFWMESARSTPEIIRLPSGSLRIWCIIDADAHTRSLFSRWSRANSRTFLSKIRIEWKCDFDLTSLLQKWKTTSGFSIIYNTEWHSKFGILLLLTFSSHIGMQFFLCIKVAPCAQYRMSFCIKKIGSRYFYT